MERPSSSPSPADIATEYQDEILAAVGAHFGLPVEELNLKIDLAFTDESEESGVYFTVVHQTGEYGVHGNYVDGSLQNITVANLQMTEFFDPKNDTGTRLS